MDSSEGMTWTEVLVCVGIVSIVLVVGINYYKSVEQQAPKGAVHTCTVMLVDEYTSVTRCIVQPLTKEDLEDVSASGSDTTDNRQSIPDL